MNINIDVKEPTHGYQNCNTNQILIYVWYVKVRESWYTQVIIWVNTILHHSDTKVILPRLWTLYRPHMVSKQKYHQICIPHWYQKKWNPHSRHPNGIKKRHTRPAMVGTPNWGEMKGRRLTLVSKVLSKVWQGVHFYITVPCPKSNTSRSCGVPTPLERSLKHSTCVKSGAQIPIPNESFWETLKTTLLTQNYLKGRHTLQPIRHELYVLEALICFVKIRKHSVEHSALQGNNFTLTKRFKKERGMHSDQ